ncbi:PREDICTED: UDP-glucuronosyltransferase 1-6-like [Rhagoletis zephyria]|uniref:UDP-glucuronosyltransferase 1-6-like n=1 Tax=Rhagoletis zephyria TaxID=28612 RepID=UPI0008114685|nr:PREDICTED: UDP-glucuronosyltransferase 1-6-like [Rhagoletis zephyria]
MAHFSAISSLLLVSVALIVISSFVVKPADGSNILGVFLSPYPSHLIVHMSVVKALAEKGHNVTVVSLFKPKVNHKNITNIIIPPLEKHLPSYQAAVARLANSKTTVIELFGSQLTSNRVLMDMQFDALLDKRFVELYENKDNKFDVAILGFFMNDFKLVVGAKFNCPIIVSWMNQPMEIVDDLMGNPTELSYLPTMEISMKVGEVMNFPTRVRNFFLTTVLKGIRLMLDLTTETHYNKFVAADPTLPSYEFMKRNISIMFCNSHYSEGPIRPLTPATILIGGIQIKEKPDPLAKDLAKLLSASQEHGAILFSLGSYITDSHVKPETLQIIYKVLSSLKQNVIWKWENLAHTPGNASNILYQKWLPQDDILAHPNLRLFITHAGKGGIAEATYHGVPMVALPLFVDQPGNAQRMVQAGYGIQLDIKKLTERIFRNAISEVLTNPSYVNKVKAFSRLYRDRPLSAKESVVYWTEYVIRHRGAAHLQSPLVKMNYIQSANLDVYLLLIGALFIILKLLQLAWRYVKKFNLFGYEHSEVQKSKRE